MIFENIITARYGFDLGGQVIAAMQDVSDRLQIPSDWLSAVCFKESGENSKARNKTGGATGLIQFMPSTAISLGTTTDELYNMSPVDQLEYVYDYFKGYTGRIKSYADLYLITFFPAAVGKPDDYIIESKNVSASLIAKENPVIDMNKDGQITVGEFKEYCLKDFSPSIVKILMTYAEIYVAPIFIISGLLIMSIVIMKMYAS